MARGTVIKSHNQDQLHSALTGYRKHRDTFVCHGPEGELL